MLTKLSVIMVAAAAPAALFLSVGYAHADVGVRAVPAPGGVDVYVDSWRGNNGPAISGGAPTPPLCGVTRSASPCRLSTFRSTCRTMGRRDSGSRVTRPAPSGTSPWRAPRAEAESPRTPPSYGDNRALTAPAFADLGDPTPRWTFNGHQVASVVYPDYELITVAAVTPANRAVVDELPGNCATADTTNAASHTAFGAGGDPDVLGGNADSTTNATGTDEPVGYFW